MTGEPRRELGRVERLAAEYDVSQRQLSTCESDASACASWRNADGSLVEDGYRLPLQQGQKGVRIAADRVGRDHKPSAMKQRPKSPDRKVEGNRMEQGPDIVRAEAEPCLCGGKQPHHVAMRHDHAFGSPVLPDV